MLSIDFTQIQCHTCTQLVIGLVKLSGPCLGERWGQLRREPFENPNPCLTPSSLCKDVLCSPDTWSTSVGCGPASSPHGVASHLATTANPDFKPLLRLHTKLGMIFF